ncbi:PKD domain-containing protein [Amycolatopsis sp. cg9]|uniref:PKD domain-containing protein n=1 Tax=Amycolatopsis sp. cg9 TaxID=3238801 RepID=UPI00352361D0
MAGAGFLRRRSTKAGLLGLASALAVGGIAAAGAGRGYPEQDVRLLSGSAWLASANVGQLTLLDGPSAEVSAQVQVATPGHALDVVQQGSTAYAVDRTAGTVRRVDGATYDPTPPVAPIDAARGGLTAFAGRTTLYTLDTQRGLIAAADPNTLAPRGDPLPLAAKLAAGTAALDDADRLWTLDDATGDLSRIADGKRTTHRQFTRPGHNLLTVANGNPVVVNPAERTATAVDAASGETTGTIPLDLRPDDALQISGSPHGDRLYVVASRGVLDICDLAAATCDTTVPLDAATRRLGAAVEAGERLFVPDYTTGQVYIVDLAHPAVIAKTQVLTPPTTFQLLTRDGIVFFNDPATERAGVIHLDGTVRDVAKYDPKNPDKGVHSDTGQTPVPQPPTGQQPPAPPTTPGSTDTPPSGTRVPPNGQVTPTDGQVPPPDGVPPTDGQFPPGTNDPGPPTDPGVPPSSTPPEPPVLRITLSKSSPMAGEDVTAKVADQHGTAPATARWDFGDSTQGDGALVVHHWATARTYQVSVQATMPDGQQATTSVSLTVSEIPKARLTVNISGSGTVTGGGISCPSTCTVTVDKGQSITLAARPGRDFAFSGWGGACSGAGACTVTVDADKAVSATFTSTLPPPSPEDCVSHDPNRLTITGNDATGYTLVDSGSHLMATLDTRQDADNALSVARGYTQHCFDSRGDSRSDWLMEYWKGGAGVAGPVSNEDCLSYNPSNLSIAEVNDANGQWWSLRDGGMWMEAFKAQGDAVRAMLVARQHSRQCFIGRNNRRPDHRGHILEYWR